MTETGVKLWIRELAVGASQSSDFTLLIPEWKRRKCKSNRLRKSPLKQKSGCKSLQQFGWHHGQKSSLTS